MESLAVASGKVIIIGDFNFPMEQESVDSVKLSELLQSTGFSQHVRDPTHVSQHMLDLVISRPDDKLISSTTVSSLITDHHAVHCKLNTHKPCLPEKTITCRSYKKVDREELSKDLNDMSIIQSPAKNLDELIDQYNSDILHVINKHAPEKTKTVTLRPHSPWYNDEIHNSKKQRRKAETTWRQSGLEIHRQIYCQARDATNSLIYEAKTKFFNNKIVDCGTDQKALFRIVKQLLGKDNQLKLPSHNSVEELLEQFSGYFTSKIHTIRSNLDKDVVTDDRPSSVLPLPGNVSSVQLQNYEKLTIDEIKKVIRKSPTKSCSLDPIPTWLLKEEIEIISPIITSIVNMSLQTSFFPPSMKHALVTPLLKKPSLDPETLKNYRPISNLPFLSKVTERVVASQLANHMDTNNLYTPVQSAYRKQHSTETALLKVLNDILVSVDKGKGVILVLLDLSAAFDTIDHDILITRLAERIGITGRALDWMRSYLKDRFQSIHINGKSSKPVLLIFGVPQGSVLGPVKFTGYQGPVFDIATAHGINSHLYADDTQIYFAFDLDNPSDYDLARTKVENCIDDVRIWMNQNKLKLNDEKTEYLILTTPRQKDKITKKSLTIGLSEISPSETAKNLGVVLDNHLTMDKQVQAICKNSNFHLRNIGKISKYLTPDSTAKVIHAFISSRLDYNNSLLYGIPKSKIQRLQRIQNSAARIITKCKKSDHISPHLQRLHWLPLQQRIKFKILTLTFRCLHGMAPSYLSSLLHPHKPTRSLRSASAMSLSVPKTRLKGYGDRAFSKAAPLLWNKLPIDLKSASTLESFKDGLKTHLYKEAFNHAT
jgi:hypothetical protein